MRAARIALWPLTALLGAVLSISPAQADVLGLGLKADPWPQWQARLSVLSPPVSTRLGQEGQLQLGAARLAGDHYFPWGRLGNGGGLRATSALLLGNSAQAMGAPSPWLGGGSWRVGHWSGGASATGEGYDAGLPAASAYLGLGYSAWWARSGLGLSADLGLIAQRPGSFRLGQRNEAADLPWHGLQLSPALQVNLSYTF